MSEKKNTALTVVENFEVPALPDNEDVQEEMDGLELSFTRVKIPSGGGLAFELPGEDDDEPDLAKEVRGVILFHHPVNAFWEAEYTGQNNPPDCSSFDGKFGEGNPGGNCKVCPNNQWGSDEQGGKACKNMRRIYILQEGEIFPLLLTLPPTSLGNFSRYITRRILQKGLRTHKVVTKVTLKKATSSGGISYSQASFKLEGVLSEEAQEAMKKYSEVIKDMASGVAIEAGDTVNGATATSSDDEPF